MREKERMEPRFIITKKKTNPLQLSFEQNLKKIDVKCDIDFGCRVLTEKTVKPSEKYLWIGNHDAVD